MTSRTRLIVLLVSAPVIAFAVIGSLLGKVAAGQGDASFRHLRVFEDVVDLVVSNYVEPVEGDRVMRGALRGLAEGLDPDSAYLSVDQVRQHEQNQPAPAGEVGLELTRQYYLRVIAARDGSPAARAGLRAGDFVRAIDNQATRELSVYEGARLLRGEPGSKVTLLVIRSNVVEPHKVELVREVVKPAEVTGRVMGSGVGYVRIPGFTAGVVDQVKATVAALRKAGATSLALDVRDNAQGPLVEGLSLARVFVPSGTLALRETQGGTKQPVETAAAAESITLPAVVLVNGGTSGAAELFAAALADSKRADLVGERTLGRAAEQKLVKLPDGSGMLLTHAWFLTPEGERIHERGLVPKVAVEAPEVEFGSTPASDPILDTAITHIAVAPAA